MIADATGPVDVQSRGVFPEAGICDCPVKWHSEMRYASGVRLICTSQDVHPMGVRFEGTRARIYVNRGRITCGPDSFKSHLESKLPAGYREGAHRDGTPAHVRNFLDVVISRKREDLNQEIFSGHVSSSMCHAGNIAWRTGKKLRFDPETETFDDGEANQFVGREHRKGFELPAI